MKLVPIRSEPVGCLSPGPSFQILDRSGYISGSFGVLVQIFGPLVSLSTLAFTLKSTRTSLTYCEENWRVSVNDQCVTEPEDLKLLES